ncbi:MAG: hypothetical protein LBU12_07020 [Deltaproteobacteria bacterium]|nr:hypothetical protein [Deltaproteobacteria bacterium]
MGTARALKIMCKQAWGAWLTLAKLTVPAMLAVRLLTVLDLVSVISRPFEPLMSLMRLPPEMALAWATAFLTTNYAGIAVYLSLLPVVGPLTVAQATVAGSLMLIAHSLPVECGVCRGAGASPLRTAALRLSAAALYGVLVGQLAAALGLGQGRAEFFVPFSFDPNPGWPTWLLSAIESLAGMLALVFLLLLMMALMRKVGLLKLFSRLLAPVMRLSGVGPKAMPIAVIGMVVGLAYGGGLIIAETRSGAVPKADVYGAITLMCLCHSLVEDTILVAAFGGSLWGLLIGRLAFATLLTAALVRAARRPAWRAVLVGRKYA